MDGQPELSARIGRLQIVGQQFTKALKTVARGMTMNAQTRGRCFDLTVMGQECRQGVDQFLALLGQWIQWRCKDT